MYFSGWMVLVAVSLWISLMAFLWGLQSGQFSDQERARYLPLRDLPPRPSVQESGPEADGGLLPAVHQSFGDSGAGRIGNFKFFPILL